MTQGRKPGNRRRAEASKQWTGRNVQHLRGLARMGCTPEEIAHFFSRTVASVRHKAWQQGIKFRHREPKFAIRRTKR